MIKETTRKGISQGGGFLNFLRQLMTAGLTLMKKVVTPLAKGFLIPLRSESASGAATQNNTFGSGTQHTKPLRSGDFMSSK